MDARYRRIENLSEVREQSLVPGKVGTKECDEAAHGRLEMFRHELIEIVLRSSLGVRTSDCEDIRQTALQYLPLIRGAPKVGEHLLDLIGLVVQVVFSVHLVHDLESI